MSSFHRGLLGIALTFAVAWGCTETASIDNDRTGSKLGKDAGAGDDDDSSSDDDDSASDDDSTSEDDDSASGDDSASDDDVTDSGRDAGRGDAGGSDAGKSDAGATDPGDGEPMMSTIEGTATASKCSSYGAAKGGMCGSYYCGVTLDQIKAELPADTLCPEPEQVCDGGLVKAVGNCARTTKAANLTANNAKLKPLVAECVKKVPEFAQLADACLGCFLDVALCAGDKCLLECLAGDSAGCDSCRKRNNCEEPVFSCAKIPNPF